MKFLFAISSWALIGYLVCLSIISKAQIDDRYKYDIKTERIVTEWEGLVGISFNHPIVGKVLKPHNKTNIGLFANIGATHFFNNRFALNIKGVYEVKGLKLESHELNSIDFNPPADQRSIQKIKLCYAEIMFLPRYYPFKKINAFLSAGPYLAYLLSEKVGSEQFVNGVSTFHSFYNIRSHNYRDIDVGVSGSIGYALRLTKSYKLTTQAIYSIGLNNTNRSTAGDLTNNSIEISFGLSTTRKLFNP